MKYELFIFHLLLLNLVNTVIHYVYLIPFTLLGCVLMEGNNINVFQCCHPDSHEQEYEETLQRGVGRAPCIANCVIIW